MTFRPQRVDVVAADAAQQLGETRRYLVGLALAQRPHPPHQCLIARRSADPFEVRRRFREAHPLAVGQHGVDGADIVDHVAVADRPRAAAVVARHAADGGARSRRWIDREEQAVGLEDGVQPVEHDAGFDRHPPGVGVDFEDIFEIPGGVEHQRLAHRLTALGGAAAARQDRHAFLGRDGDGARDVVRALRDDDADGLDLVDRGVGAVAPAAEAVEQHLALDLLAKPGGEGAAVAPVA